jgi:flagellar biosynthesis protein FlhF
VIVKRFVGDSAEVALYRAKAELGEDAIILSSGPTRDVWWRFWQRRYQVLVAADMGKRDRPRFGARGAPAPAAVPPAPVLAPVVQAPPAPPPAPVEPAPDPFRDQVVDMLRTMDQRLQTLTTGSERPDRGLVDRLEAAGVGAVLAQELALAVAQSGSDDPDRALTDAVVQILGEPAPVSLRDRVILTAVGPTGSGKTTTLAKLAAHFTLVQQKSVLLVTTDTFRVAAAEQLKTFALILGIPLEVAARPQDLDQVVDRANQDIILVDTAGRSPFHDLHVAEIQSMVRAARTKELLIVLPATMRAESMVHSARRFAGSLPDARLCFTKLDESQWPGAMITAAAELGWPLAYFADGQDVPEDIAIADPRRLAAWLLKGEDLGG